MFDWFKTLQLKAGASYLQPVNGFMTNVKLLNEKYQRLKLAIGGHIARLSNYTYDKSPKPFAGNCYNIQ